MKDRSWRTALALMRDYRFSVTAYCLRFAEVVSSAFRTRGDTGYYIDLLGITKAGNRVRSAVVFQVSCFFTELLQIHKDFIAQKVLGSRVLRALNNQHRRLYAIEIKERRVFQISLTILPGSATHLALANFGPSLAHRSILLRHETIESSQAHKARVTHSCLNRGV